MGRETAILLAAGGVEVMAVGRTEATLKALGETAPVHYMVGSVSTEAGCEGIVAETRRRLGPISILVNNAGSDSDDERPIWEQRSRLFDEVLATNLFGPFHLSRLASADMVKQRWGRIVMVASTAGLVGGKTLSAFTTSKHGLIGLMRSIALDVAPYGVTCNAVCPGWVRTETLEVATAEEASERGVDPEQIWAERDAESPAGRIVTAREVAEVVNFLASERASGVNGETVTIALGSLW